VIKADIIDGLRRIGLDKGDVVFVHSSLSSFGHVNGGAETVVKAFLEVLGSEGTLAVPIFRNYFWDGPEQIWDRDNSPSLMGIISETVRTWEGNRRSYHAPHPIAAVGRLADDLTERHNITDFSFDSPFSRLIELNAWIVLLGVDYNRCTMIHLIEERSEIPYRRWIDLAGTVVNNGIAERKTYPFLSGYPGVGNDFNPLGERLQNEGKVNITKIGNSLVRSFRSKDLYDCAMRSIRQDPLFLVSHDTKAQASKYIPKYGKMLDESFDENTELICLKNPIAKKLTDKLRIPQTPPPIVEIRQKYETNDELILEEFHIRNGLSDFIPGVIAIPKDLDKKLPAVICMHGTGESWEQLMEKPFIERNGTLIGWAREFARRGFISVAITQFSHPPRHEPWNWELPKLLPAYGKTAMGWLVSDVLSCVDYLQTRPEVDSEHIAVGGFSLGGISAFYSFVVDDRIASAFTFCGGVGSIRHLIREGNTGFHSIYYYVPDIISDGLDHPQLVPAFAPRPLFIYGTTDDAGMPVSGLKAFESSTIPIYESLGAGDKIKVVLEEGQHALNFKAFNMVSDWLRDIFSDLW
jgi:aminoglycoside 3-N-acetyltransferase